MNQTAAIIGAGLVGRAWAVVFARAGWRVRLHDPDPSALERAMAWIPACLRDHETIGLAGDAAAAAACVSAHASLADALAGAEWVQENGPEVVEELNAPGGIADYAARYAAIYRRIAADPARPSVWDAENAARVSAALGPPAVTVRARRPHALARRTPRRTARPSAQRARIRRRRLTMSTPRKVIITCAVTGSIHTPSMSPYLPITPREIADAAVGAAQAGAAIVHLHARDPVDGRPTQDPKWFREFAPEIARRCDVVQNFTTGGAATMSIDERLQPALMLKPEVASLNMGSMNFGLYPMLARYPKFKHDWEREYLAGSEDRIFKNTFTDIARILRSCAENSTRFEIECYDIGHLYTAAHFLDRSLLKPPLLLQSVFGILGGIGAHPDDVAHMKRTADRLFGDAYQWSVLGAGRNQLGIAAMSVAMGGHLRVGLEDSLWIGPGKLAESNAAQVRKAREIVEGMGLQIATPDEARALLELKGRDRVAF